MNVYIVRHAEAEHNIDDIANDRSSLTEGLTARGIEQAKQLSLDLTAQNFDAVFSSQQERAIETASILIAGRGITIQKDERINDIRTGMQGRPFAEFRKLLANSKDKWNMRFNDGESFEDEKARTLSFVNDLKSRHYEDVLIVTHGGVANIIYGFVHGLTNDQIFDRPIANAELFSFELQTS